VRKSLIFNIILSNLAFLSAKLHKNLTYHRISLLFSVLNPISLDEFWYKIIAILTRVYEKISQELPVKKNKKAPHSSAPHPSWQAGIGVETQLFMFQPPKHFLIPSKSTNQLIPNSRRQ